MKHSIITPCFALVLASCTSGASDNEQVQTYDGIGEGETIDLLGTEPFWSAEIIGNQLTYSTPEDIDGMAITVTRFAGNNGLGFNGTLEGVPMQVAITPGVCSDGMSDREYPFTATITLGDTMLEGCGYSSENPFIGEENP